MGRRRRKEGKQSDRLQEIGFGQDIPQDGFSDQPSSGGRIGGVRGVQEYGIEGGIAGERERSSGGEGVDERLVDELDAASSSLAEYSAEGTAESEDSELAEDLYGEEYIGGEDLRKLIEDRLEHNSHVHSGAIDVAVEPFGQVVLNGTVETESESVRVSEIVASIPGVRDIDNRLRVVRPIN
jgi:hypothetical protein